MDNTFISTELFKHLMEGKALGLTKREYFAGLAMQGFLASMTTRLDSDRLDYAKNFAIVAINSVNAANALCIALEVDPSSSVPKP